MKILMTENKMPTNLNKSTFIGRLGAAPETRYTPSGLAVSRFNLAVSDDYYDKNKSEWVNRTQWIPVTAFGPLAERVEEKLNKGSQVYVECKVSNNKYTNKDGVEVNTFGFQLAHLEILTQQEKAKKAETQQADDFDEHEDVQGELLEDEEPPF